MFKNTFYHRHLYEIFKHEFVMLVWLPEQGFDLSTYKHTANRVLSDPRFCYCNLEKAAPTDEKWDLVSYRGPRLMVMVELSVD